MSWRILSLAFLLAVALAGYFAWRKHPSDLPVLGRAAPQAPKPGYFMNQARVVQTGEDGLPLYSVDAERIRQNPNDSNVHLENLRLNYYPRSDQRGGNDAQPSQQPAHWLLTAKTGVMPQDARRIELQEDVEIKGRPATNNGQNIAPATIRTSNLAVDIDAQTARTRERVDIVWGGRQLSATGMRADLKAERIKLESSIHGQFVR